MRYIAPRRNGFTGLGKERLVGFRPGLSVEEKMPPCREAGENTGGVRSDVEVEVLGNTDTSVTGIKDFPADPNGLKPLGSVEACRVGCSVVGLFVSSDCLDGFLPGESGLSNDSFVLCTTFSPSPFR